MPKFSSKRSDISSFLAMDVLRDAGEAERKGQSIIHMEVGQPASPVPKKVLVAAQNALAGGRLGYTDALGIDPLRERIAIHYKDYYGVSVPAHRIIVTTGSSGAFNLAFLATFDVGDKIGLPSPGYPAYRNILKALGLQVVDIETEDGDRWTLSPQTLAKAHEEHGLAGVLVASPANPSGTMLTPEALRHICGFCDENEITFMSDEIYQRLSYGDGEETALKYSQEPIVINSFSKYYCMTGWRIGWMIAPDYLVRSIERLAQNLFISAPELSQHAGIAAFDATEEYEAIKTGYAENRDIVTKALVDMGLTDFLPVDGAFYVYLNVAQLTSDSMAFSRSLLAETGIAVAPGADFDPVRGNEFVRLSFAGQKQDMKTAMERLGNWLNR